MHRNLCVPAIVAVLVGLAALGLPAAVLAQGTPFHLVIVPNFFSDDVSILDTGTQTEVARIATGPEPALVAASPDGQFAYVGETAFGPMNIDRINLATLALEDVLTINGSSYLAELEISPDGRWLAAGEAAMGTTYIIDTANWTVTATVVLCPICDGQTTALYSAPNVAFSSDSATLYAATGVNRLLTVIDVATGAVVETRPAQNSFGPPYADIEVAPGGEVVLSVPTNDGSVRVFHPGGGEEDLSLRQSNVADIALVPSGTETLVASGSILTGGDQDFLSLKSLQGGPERRIQASESLRYLRYNPLRNELWAPCIFGGADCPSFAIDVFDMGTMKRTHKLPGVGGALTLGRHPGFSPDYRFFYQPMGSLDAVLVIDTGTKQVVTQIPVGTGPVTVVAQGDVGPHEHQ